MDIIKFGKRHRCYHCQALFYNLGKDLAICPKCGADQANAPKPEQRLQELEDRINPETDEIVGYDEELGEKDAEVGEEEELVNFDEEET